MQTWTSGNSPPPSPPPRHTYLGGELLAGRLAAGGLACRLLGAGHGCLVGLVVGCVCVEGREGCKGGGKQDGHAGQRGQGEPESASKDGVQCALRVRVCALQRVGG